MRYQNRFRLIWLLAGAAFIGSCTCREKVEQVAAGPAVSERPAGFHGSQKTIAPPTVAAAVTMPPTEPVELTPTVTPQAGISGIPPDFPSDVALMKDAEVAMVNELAGNARNVLVRTEDDRDKMYDFYQNDLREKGWVLEQHYKAKQQSFLSFRKGNTILNMTLTDDPNNPGKRIVGVMYYDDKPPEFGDF